MMSGQVNRDVAHHHITRAQVKVGRGPANTATMQLSGHMWGVTCGAMAPGHKYISPDSHCSQCL